jgi:hypothetical protein
MGSTISGFLPTAAWLRGSLGAVAGLVSVHAAVSHPAPIPLHAELCKTMRRPRCECNGMALTFLAIAVCFFNFPYINPTRFFIGDSWNNIVTAVFIA